MDSRTASSSASTGREQRRYAPKTSESHAEGVGKSYPVVRLDGQATAILGDVHTLQYHAAKYNGGEKLRGFKDQFLESLVYPEIDDRINQIENPDSVTFNWIFDDSLNQPWASFSTWLMHGTGIYWIYGKAGSGKSTLMKSIWDDERTLEHLTSPSRPTPYILRHSFWLAGTSMQKNFKGLLCSILHEFLFDDVEAIELLLRKQPGLKRKFTNSSWSIKDLQHLLLDLVKQRTSKSNICIFLDGLDEIEQTVDRERIFDLLKYFEKSKQVKFCVSSRYEYPWIDEFKNLPQLRLQDLTRPDIEAYVSNRLRRAWRQITQSQLGDSGYQDLVRQICFKASGVFLWVNLAVTSLLEGSRGASWEELQTRLKSLPGEVISLYEDMLRRRSKDTAAVVNEAATYLKLCLDSYAPFSVQHCVVLRHFLFSSTCYTTYDATFQEFERDCVNSRERIRDICAGMITFQRIGTLPLPRLFSHDKRTETDEQKHRHDSDLEEDASFLCSDSTPLNPSCHEYNGQMYGVHLKFHHRTVVDFLQDTPAGKEFIKRSRLTKADLLASIVETELVLFKTHIDMFDLEAVVHILQLIQKFQRDNKEEVTELDVALQIRRLIDTLHVVLPADGGRIAPAFQSVFTESHQIFKLFQGQHPHTCIDVTGLSLKLNITALFNEFLAPYLNLPGRNGQVLTLQYKNYLLRCAVAGSVIDVARKLVEAGANMSTPPFSQGPPWAVCAAGELLKRFFVNRNVGHDETIAWHEIVRRTTLTSSYMMLQYEPSGYIVQPFADWSQAAAFTKIFVLIDVKLHLQMLFADLLPFKHTQEERDLLQVSPTDYAGYAIFPERSKFVPLTMQAWKVLISHALHGHRVMSQADRSGREEILQHLKSRVRGEGFEDNYYILPGYWTWLLEKDSYVRVYHQVMFLEQQCGNRIIRTQPSKGACASYVNTVQKEPYPALSSVAQERLRQLQELAQDGQWRQRISIEGPIDRVEFAQSTT